MKKRRFLIAACIIIAVSLFFSPAFAAYSWVDDNGVFHITDYPKPVKREEPKDMAPEPAEPEMKQSPVQTAPVAPTPPPVPVAATAPMSTGTPTVKPLLPAVAVVPSSAGTPTLRPSAPLSQLTPTPGGHDAMATAATVSLLTTTATTTAPLPVMQEQPQTSLPMPGEPQKMTAAYKVAYVMAFFMIFFILFVYPSLCLFLIAKKLNVSSPWTAWIPIVQIWTYLQAAGKPCWWVLLFCIPVVGVIVFAYVWMCIVENLGRNKWLGLLTLVPIVGFVYIGVLAFSKQEHQELQEEPHEQADDISGQEWKPSEDSSEEHE